MIDYLEAHPVASKIWDVDPAIKPNAGGVGAAGGGGARALHLQPSAKEEDKVLRVWDRKPIPGYRIKSIKVIYNPEHARGFETSLGMLNARHNKKEFLPAWMLQGNVEQQAQRQRIMDEIEALAAEYQDRDNPHVRMLPMWHGTSREAIDSICEVGFANLASTDSGYFGKGLYATLEPEYAHRVYSKDKGILLLCWVHWFSAYPVIHGDRERLAGGGNYRNYDSHFVPVVGRSNNEWEKSFVPCMPGQRPRYHEMVVFSSAQILPRYILEVERDTGEQV